MKTVRRKNINKKTIQFVEAIKHS